MITGDSDASKKFYRTVIKKKRENDRSIFPFILRCALGVERRAER